jgi:DNA-binding Lrp family transcriptional regulator
MEKSFFLSSDKNPKNIQIKKEIINHFVNNGNDTIAELSKGLDLSVPTVTKLIAELTEMGLVADFGKIQTSGGRYPNVYGLNPSSVYFVGVDMTRHHLNIALMDFKGDIVKYEMGISYMYENTTESFDRLCSHNPGFYQRNGRTETEDIQYLPQHLGRVNPESGYSYSSFYFSEEPISNTLANRLNYRVTVDNDTRSMAYGEFMKGSVQSENNVIFVNVSWGWASASSSTKNSTTANRDSLESLAISPPSTMKLSAIAARRVAWKRKHRDLPFTARCLNG